MCRSEYSVLPLLFSNLRLKEVHDTRFQKQNIIDVHYKGTIWGLTLNVATLMTVQNTLKHNVEGFIILLL